MVELDRGGPRVERRGVGSDHPLTGVGGYQPVILEVARQMVDLRLLEEDVDELRVTAQPLFDLRPRGRLTEPDVAVTIGS